MLGNQNQCKGEITISYLDDLSLLSNGDIENRINTLIVNIFEYNFYLNFKETKKYLEKIEYYSSCVEENFIDIM